MFETYNLLHHFDFDTYEITLTGQAINMNGTLPLFSNLPTRKFTIPFNVFLCVFEFKTVDEKENVCDFIEGSETFRHAKMSSGSITPLMWLNAIYLYSTKPTIDMDQCSSNVVNPITPITGMAQIVNNLGGTYNYGYIVKHPRIKQHGMVINFHQQNNKLKYSVLRINHLDKFLTQTSWVIDNIEIITPINLSCGGYGTELDKDYIYKLLTNYNKTL